MIGVLSCKTAIALAAEVSGQNLIDRIQCAFPRFAPLARSASCRPSPSRVGAGSAASRLGGRPLHSQVAASKCNALVGGPPLRKLSFVRSQSRSESFPLARTNSRSFAGLATSPLRSRHSFCTASIRRRAPPLHAQFA